MPWPWSWLAWTFPPASAIWPWSFRSGTADAASTGGEHEEEAERPAHRTAPQHPRGCAAQHARGERPSGGGAHPDRDRDAEHLGEWSLLLVAALPGAGFEGGAHHRAPAAARDDRVQGPDQ